MSKNSYGITRRAFVFAGIGAGVVTAISNIKDFSPGLLKRRFPENNSIPKATYDWLPPEEIAGMFKHMDDIQHDAPSARFSPITNLPTHHLIQLIGAPDLMTNATTFRKISNLLLDQPDDFSSTIRTLLSSQDPRGRDYALNAMRNFIAYNRGDHLVSTSVRLDQDQGNTKNPLEALQSFLIEELIGEEKPKDQNDRTSAMVLIHLSDLVARLYSNNDLRQKFEKNFWHVLKRFQSSREGFFFDISDIREHYRTVRSGYNTNPSPLTPYMPKAFSPEDARNEHGRIVAVSVLGDFERERNIKNDFYAIYRAFKKEGWKITKSDGFLIMERGSITHCINRPENGETGLANMKAYTDSIGGASIVIQRGRSDAKNLEEFEKHVTAATKAVIFGGSFSRAHDDFRRRFPPLQIVENTGIGATGTNNEVTLRILGQLAVGDPVDWDEMARNYPNQRFPSNDLSRAIILKRTGASPIHQALPHVLTAPNPF